MSQGEEHTITQQEFEFRAEVIERLAELKSGNVAINGRLDKVNGGLGRHEQDIVLLKAQPAARADFWPLVEELRSRVEELRSDKKSFAAAAQAQAQQNAKYQRILQPLVKMIAGALLMLALEHGAEIAKFMKP